jgi:hypothetical protein
LHGIAAIIGTLSIAHPASFIPNVGDAFAILTYTGHSGAFGTVAGAAAGARTFDPTHAATDLTLNVT